MTIECAATPIDKLLQTALEQLRIASGGGVVVALTSANSGEGVTHSVTALPSSLQREESRRILRVGACDLRSISCAPASLFRCCKAVGDNLFDFKYTAASSSLVNSRYSWTDNWKYRRDCVAQLRSSFDYVLVDCPALKATDDALLLAPLVDGVIIVVEADRTKIDEILQAENTIEFAGGKLVGHILNKWYIDLPGWLIKAFR